MPTIDPEDDEEGCGHEFKDFVCQDQPLGLVDT